MSTNIRSIGEGIPLAPSLSSATDSVVNFNQVKGLRRWLVGLDVGGVHQKQKRVEIDVAGRTRRPRYLSREQPVHPPELPYSKRVVIVIVSLWTSEVPECAIGAISPYE